MSILDYSSSVHLRDTEMPVIYATAEERRRGGWLARAEGRVKTEGVPIGPRPESLKRILEGAESAPSSCCGVEDATNVRREVGSGRRNDARDVIAVKQVLHEAGLYTMPCTAAPSPIFDSEMRVAIRTFQGRHGLKEDGVIRPGDLLPKARDDAPNPRCRQLAVDIGNGALDLEDLSEAINVLDAKDKKLSGQIETLWSKIRRDLIVSTVSFLLPFLRAKRLLDKLLDAIRGGAKDVAGIAHDVRRVQGQEDEQKRVINEKKRILRLQSAQQNKLRGLLRQSEALGCDTPHVALTS